MAEALHDAAEPALERQRRGHAPEPAGVFPGVHVQQPAARRQAEPDAGEAEGLPVLVLSCVGRIIRPLAMSCDKPKRPAPRSFPGTAGACDPHVVTPSSRLVGPVTSHR